MWSMGAFESRGEGVALGPPAASSSGAAAAPRSRFEPAVPGGEEEEGGEEEDAPRERLVRPGFRRARGRLVVALREPGREEFAEGPRSPRVGPRASTGPINPLGMLAMNRATRVACSSGAKCPFRSGTRCAASLSRCCARVVLVACAMRAARWMDARRRSLCAPWPPWPAPFAASLASLSAAVMTSKSSSSASCSSSYACATLLTRAASAGRTTSSSAATCSAARMNVHRATSSTPPRSSTRAPPRRRPPSGRVGGVGIVVTRIRHRGRRGSQVANERLELVVQRRLERRVENLHRERPVRRAEPVAPRGSARAERV